MNSSQRIVLAINYKKFRCLKKFVSVNILAILRIILKRLGQTLFILCLRSEIMALVEVDCGLGSIA